MEETSARLAAVEEQAEALSKQLDDESASLYLDFLHKLNKEQGIGIILVEHRLERCLRYADRVLFIESGRVIADGTPEAVMPLMRENRLMADFNRDVRGNGHGDVVLSAQGLTFAYDRDAVLSGLDLSVRDREVVAIIGHNGSGKSTLLKQLNGLLRPAEGTVAVMGKNISEATTASLARDIGYLGQNPNNYLFEDTLERELQFTLRNLQVPEPEWSGRIDWTLKMLDLERYRHSFPRDLSCGERARPWRPSWWAGPGSWCWTSRRADWTTGTNRGSHPSSAHCASRE